MRPRIFNARWSLADFLVLRLALHTRQPAFPLQDADVRVFHGEVAEQQEPVQWNLRGSESHLDDY
jgi:hypothetical protein